MSQNRKDKAKGSEDVHEEESAAASPNRVMCDVCKKEKDIKQIACFWSEGISPPTIICRECTEKNIEEYKEKKGQRKRE